MKQSLYAVLFVVLTLALAKPSGAQDYSENLPGTWVLAETVGRSWNGTRFTEADIDYLEFEVFNFDGVTFSVRWRWQVNTEELEVDDGVQEGTSGDETLVGVKDFDGTFIMVDRPDTGMHRIKMLGPDTMEIVGIESGPNAVVARSIFRRK